MRILGLIPARGGSKGVPGKNIKLLGNKPLLAYTSEIALQSNYLVKTVLSSDDDKIIEVAKSLGVEIPFKRPSNLAEDSSPTLPVIKHVLDYYKAKGEFFDAVCLLQVTSPFRTVSFLDEALNKFINSDTDSLVSVQEVPHEYNPHWTFELNKQGNLKIATGETEIITRRQELPKAYHRDGSIYITKTAVIEKQNSLFGNSIAYIESPKEFYVNIDTLKDWEKAELLLKNNI
ncbi:acylneuraminate cytidylyltransferase family protein [Polaribacter sp. L3A8]|uniref:acylneuraminate cytidylyltransferase family protein n=1 Tax=Polaribacter sp. L3A8 TaxID=2686361 RepID=UPI00131ACAFE|nr:acylneuraminate cytidylyltransferase family protein [Polaribacter sp. L3A8]